MINGTLLAHRLSSNIHALHLPSNKEMPDKKKSNHIFLPILDFTSNSLYINASRDLPSKSRDCFEFYGFDQLDDNNPRHYRSPHKIHRSWCGTKKARLCNCRPEANLGNKALVRIGRVFISPIPNANPSMYIL